MLALSSAGGTAPLDAALRRYVELVTADGALDVDLIEPRTVLAPDEQIEVFRIVQEGLANVRKHAGARHAEVRIGERLGPPGRDDQDDGVGFEGPGDPAGLGLQNMRRRARRSKADSRCARGPVTEPRSRSCCGPSPPQQRRVTWR